MPHIHERYDFVVSAFVVHRDKVLLAYRFYCRRALQAAKTLIVSALFLCAAFVGVRPAGAATQIEAVRVVEVSGDVQVLFPSTDLWKPLLAPLVLSKGFQVKTGEKGFIDLSLNRGLTSLARLGENSHLDVLDAAPYQVKLERGAFFVLREDPANPGDTTFSKKAVPPLSVLTEDASAQILDGGCSISVSGGRTLVRVFSEDVVVFGLERGSSKASGQVVSEGFRFSSPGTDKTARPKIQRMHYGDYIDWQAWFRQVCERRDAFSADALEKELAA